MEKLQKKLRLRQFESLLAYKWGIVGSKVGLTYILTIVCLGPNNRSAPAKRLYA